MVSKSSPNAEAKERPVFIPPRKRQVTKKTNGAQNYVDHIANVAGQNRQKSPSNLGLEEDLVKTSLILKNKQPLPQIPGSELGDPEKCSNASKDDIYEDDNELHNFESISQGTKSTIRLDSSVTPTSFSESSLDAKLSKSHDCLSSRSSSSKKRVNIRTDLRTRNSPEIANYEDLESGETSVLNELERYNTRKSFDSNNYLTMTGTVKRGRKKGQSLDLQINISREELEQINAVTIATEVNKSQNLCCSCSCNTGLHVFVWSLLCLPFVTVISAVYSFYVGTICWYNMFNYFNEKSYLSKIFMSPLLILAYPMGIIVCTLGLGLYSGLAQLSLQFTSWRNEVADIEKGFYGWLCGFLHLSDCSPYEVIILTDIRPSVDDDENADESQPPLNKVNVPPARGKGPSYNKARTEEMSL